MEPTRIFVTGATGVVGRPLVPLLVHHGHTVVAVARTAAKAERLTADGAQPVQLDRYDAKTLARVMQGCELAIDLTTHVPPLHRAARRRAWRQHDWLRDQGTAAVVAAAELAGVRRVVRDSVAFLHADGGDQWIDEQWPLEPGEQLASAVAAERHVAGFAGEGVVLRFSLLYGPESSHTQAAIDLARRLRVSPVLGPAGAYLSSLHTEDAASSVLAALSAPPGTYDVGDDEPLTRAAHVAAQASALGLRRLRRPPSALAPRSAESQLRSQRIDARRLRTATGWAPRYRSAREGWAAIAAA